MPLTAPPPPPRQHALQPEGARWRCTVCHWTFKTDQPRDACPGLPRYRATAVPPELRSPAALRAAGLAPTAPPRGCIVPYPGATILLYNLRAVQPTPRGPARPWPVQRGAPDYTQPPHYLESDATGGRCHRCDQAFSTDIPPGGCPGVPVFAFATRPAHLRTRRELQSAGRLPAGPVVGASGTGVGRGRFLYDALYDGTQTRPWLRPCPRCQRSQQELQAHHAGVVLERAVCAACAVDEAAAEATAHQQAAIAAEEARQQAAAAQAAAAQAAAAEAGVIAYARQTLRQQAAVWAAARLATPGWVTVDLETTGLEAGAEIVQIAVRAPDGQVLLESLVRPSTQIPATATQIHHLDAAAVADAPTYPDLHGLLTRLLVSQGIIAYNAPFVRRLLAQTAARYGLRPPSPLWWECAMERYAEWVGAWRAHHHEYRWQPRPGADHSALGDSQATLDVLHQMAVLVLAASPGSSDHLLPAQPGPPIPPPAVEPAPPPTRQPLRFWQRWLPGAGRATDRE